jgi:hypothetical protein
MDRHGLMVGYVGVGGDFSFLSATCYFGYSVIWFGFTIKPKPRPNTEQHKNQNRTRNRKPNKPIFRFGLVCGLRVKNAQGDEEPDALDLFKECHYSKKRKCYAPTVQEAIVR